MIILSMLSAALKVTVLAPSSLALSSLQQRLQTSYKILELDKILEY